MNCPFSFFVYFLYIRDKIKVGLTIKSTRIYALTMLTSLSINQTKTVHHHDSIVNTISRTKNIFVHFLFTFLYNHDCKYIEPCKVILYFISFVNNSFFVFCSFSCSLFKIYFRAKFSINHHLKDAYWVHCQSVSDRIKWK